MARDRHSRDGDKRANRLRKIAERQERQDKKTKLSVREQLELVEKEDQTDPENQSVLESIFDFESEQDYDLLDDWS